MNRTLVLTVLASIVAVGLVACKPAPTPTPLPPTDTPIPTATVTVPTVEEVQASAWVSHSRPGWGSILTVFAKLTQDDQGIANAQMYCIVHDADADRRWPSEGFERTGDDGIASTSTIVMENPEGAVVQLDVYLIYEGSTYQAQASFVSHC
jgi:hypothetical protein